VKLSLVLALLVAIPASPQVCSVPACPTPQREYCDDQGPAEEFEGCQARNRQEQQRHFQCLQERRRKCAREKQERERKAHEKYCRQNPEAAECK